MKKVKKLKDNKYLSTETIVHENKKLSAILDKNNKEINDTGWINLNDYVKYRKKNSVVYVIATVMNGPEVGTDENYVSLGMLPQGFNPDFDIPFTYHCVGGNNFQQSAFIYPSGKIVLYKQPSAGIIQHYAFSVSFPV